MLESGFSARTILLVAALAGASLATAQNTPSDFTFPSVKFDSIGVHEALDRLFKTVKTKFPKATYVLDSGAMGAVKINRKDVSLDTVLQDITRQIDATWQIDEGYVYHISPHFAPRALPNVQQYRDEIKGRLKDIASLPNPETARPPLDPDLKVTLLNDAELRQIKARAAVLATNKYRVTGLAVNEIIDFRPELITVDVIVTYTKPVPKAKPFVYKDRWQLKETGGWMLLWRREYTP